MLFISRHRSPSFVIIHASREIIETNVGRVVNNRPPVVIYFEPFGVSFNTTLLPTIGGKNEASGFFNTEKGAKKLVLKGLGFNNSDGEDVTESRLIEFLYTHDEYGKEFVAIGKDGGEVKEEDQVFIPEGDSGGFYCTVCEKHLANIQAKEGHRTTSNEHKKNFSKRFEKLTKDLFNAAKVRN